MPEAPHSTKKFLAYYESPVGLIEVCGNESAVTTLNFVDTRLNGRVSRPHLDDAVRQIDEYFQKKRRLFDLKLDLSGTAFQKMVWERLIDIPYGTTTTYREMAEDIGRPKAQRAVGAANGKNPVSIIVPCHRMIGSDRGLTGYGGGLWRKAWLLEHEGAGSFAI